MRAHDWWHMIVLGSTLFGAAGLAILLLVPIAFDEPPPGFKEARATITLLVALAVLLLGAEWLGVH